jgi:hypothetical protein
METERKVIEAPEPSLDFKFRKISLAWILTLTETIKILLEQGGPELAQIGVERTADAWAGKLGKHIVRDHEIPDTVEGALQLLDTYNQIFTAAKMNGYVEGDVGYFEILDCTHWDLLCGPLGIRCDESCENHECPSLLKALGDFDVEFIECKPRGGDRCSLKITKP